MSMLSYVLFALLVTEMAELLVAAGMGVRDFHGLRVVFLANLMTNPLISGLYLTGRIFIGPKLQLTLLAAEILVWIAEAVVYKICIIEKSHPFFLSAAANAASVVCGVWIGRWS